MELNRDVFENLYAVSDKYDIPYLKNVSEMVLNLSPEEFSEFVAKILSVFENAGVKKEKVGGKSRRRGGGKYDTIIKFIASILLLLSVAGESIKYEECGPGGYLYDSQEVIDCRLKNARTKLAYEISSSDMEVCRTLGMFDSKSETAANKARCLRNDSREKQMVLKAAQASKDAADDAADDNTIRRAANTLKAAGMNAEAAREKASTATAEASEAAASLLTNEQLRKLTLENDVSEVELDLMKETVVVAKADTGVIVARKGLEADNIRRERKTANRAEFNSDIQYYGSFAALFLGLYLLGDKIYSRGVAAGQQKAIPTPAIAGLIASAIAAGAPVPGLAPPGLAPPGLVPPGLAPPGLVPPAPGFGLPRAQRPVPQIDRNTPGMFPQLPMVARGTILPGYGAISNRNPEPVTYPELLTNVLIVPAANVEQAYAASQSGFRLYIDGPQQLTNVGELLDAFTRGVPVGIRWTDDPNPANGGRKTKINKKKKRRTRSYR